MSNINPFDHRSDQPFWHKIMFILIFPILFLMTVWERLGCSRFLPQDDGPEIVQWDIEIAYWNPNPIGINRPWNSTLLTELDDQWKNNFVTSVTVWIDENYKTNPDDEPGRIVQFFDPPLSTGPEQPLIEMTLDFYRIDGELPTDGPSPKFVMVQKFKGKETPIVVVAISRGPKDCFVWKAEHADKYKDRSRFNAEFDAMYFNLDGSGGPTNKMSAEDAAKLIKLSP